LTALQLSYANEDDLGFIFKPSTAPLTEIQRNSRAERVRRRLHACSKGLLEVHRTSKHELADSTVGYLHRTVKDYIERGDTWRRLLDATNTDFNPRSRLAVSHISLLKFQRDYRDSERIWKEVILAISNTTAGDPDGSEVQIRLLDELDLASRRHHSWQHRPWIQA
jgi:hypothetical protein